MKRGSFSPSIQCFRSWTIPNNTQLVLCHLTHAQVRLLPRPLREWHAFLAVFFNLTSPLFFLDVIWESPEEKGGNSGEVCSLKYSLLLSHAFDLTCKLQCKFHCGLREWAGECTPWAGSVCVHVSVNRGIIAFMLCLAPLRLRGLAWVIYYDVGFCF